MSKSKDVTEGAKPCAERRMREERKLSVIWLGEED